MIFAKSVLVIISFCFGCHPAAQRASDPLPIIEWVFLYGLDDSLCVASSKEHPPLFIQNVSRCELVLNRSYLYVVRSRRSEYQLFASTGHILFASNNPFGVLGSTIISSEPITHDLPDTFKYKIMPFAFHDVDHRWSDKGLLWIQDSASKSWFVVSEEGDVKAGPFAQIAGFSATICQYRKHDGEVGVIDTSLKEIAFSEPVVISGPFSGWFAVHYSDGDRRDEIWNQDEKSFAFQVEQPVSYDVTASGILVGYEDGVGAVMRTRESGHWTKLPNNLRQKLSWEQSDGKYAFFYDGEHYILTTGSMQAVYSTRDLSVGPVRPVGVDDRGWSIHRDDDFVSYFVLDPKGNTALQFAAP